MTETLFRTFAASDLEVRATGRTIVGWAARFNEPTLIGGDHGYTETIPHGAFARTIAERGNRVKVLRGHDDRAPIGRASLLREDPQGLWAELKISATAAGDDVLELARDGVLDLSIGFVPVPAADRWSQDRSKVTRGEIRLLEISTVALAAQDNSRVVGVRSLNPPTFSVALARRRALLEGAI